jgi:hypothetical protein
MIGYSDIRSIKTFQTTCGITFEFVPYNKYEITFSEFIMSRLRAERPRNHDSITIKGKRDFLYLTQSRYALGSTHCVLGDLSLGIKQQGREADLSPPLSSEEKNVWRYTSPPRTPSWLAQRQL